MILTSSIPNHDYTSWGFYFKCDGGVRWLGMVQVNIDKILNCDYIYWRSSLDWGSPRPLLQLRIMSWIKTLYVVLCHFIIYVQRKSARWKVRYSLQTSSKKVKYTLSFLSSSPYPMLVNNVVLLTVTNTELHHTN